jgi:predicted transporter
MSEEVTGILVMVLIIGIGLTVGFSFLANVTEDATVLSS